MTIFSYFPASNSIFRMKTVLFNLLLLATVFLVSSALPRDRGEDHQSLLESDTSLENGKNPLQRRRPPVKVPGPKLIKPENEEAESEGDLKLKKLSKGKKEAKLTKDNKHKNEDFASLDDDSKRGKKGKGKDKDLVRKDEEYSTDEETQEERNSNIFRFSPQTEEA